MDRMNEIELRLAEIEELSKAEDTTNFEELLEEVRSLKAERDAINHQIEERNKLEAEVVEKAEVVEDFEEIRMENKEMTNLEIRNTKDYIDAYAEYVKSGNDEEVRKLLSENGGGKVAVPSFVEEIVKTAWDKENLTALCRKTYLAGNVKVGFEISATGAVVHTEGADAPAEETLTLGIVTMVPASIKKWITISDEALDMGGEAFLTYIYSELTYQIAKKCADELVAKIDALTTTATATAVNVGEVEDAPSVDTIAKAISELSDEAADPTIVMNKKTYADFKAIQNSANYGIDVFEGCKVVFNNSLPAYADAEADDTYVIVGDFGRGAMLNFPNGEEITIKYDDLSLAEADLVKIVAREYVAIGVVAPLCFAKVTKPSA